MENMIDEWMDHYNIEIRTRKYFGSYIEDWKNCDPYDFPPYLQDMDSIDLKLNYVDISITNLLGTEKENSQDIEVCLSGSQNSIELFLFFVIFDKKGMYLNDAFREL